MKIPKIIMPKKERDELIKNKEICLRCGRLRKDIRNHHYVCQYMGTEYDKHIYQ